MKKELNLRLVKPFWWCCVFWWAWIVAEAVLVRILRSAVDGKLALLVLRDPRPSSTQASCSSQS
jgi:hypothetical protein